MAKFEYLLHLERPVCYVKHVALHCPTEIQRYSELKNHGLYDVRNATATAMLKFNQSE